MVPVVPTATPFGPASPVDPPAILVIGATLPFAPGTNSSTELLLLPPTNTSPAPSSASPNGPANLASELAPWFAIHSPGATTAGTVNVRSTPVRTPPSLEALSLKWYVAPG